MSLEPRLRPRATPRRSREVVRDGSPSRYVWFAYGTVYFDSQFSIGVAVQCTPRVTSVAKRLTERHYAMPIVKAAPGSPLLRATGSLRLPHGIGHARKNLSARTIRTAVSLVQPL